MTITCPVPAQNLFRIASARDLCLQINLIGIDHTQKAYLCIKHKDSQSTNLACMCAEKKGRSNKIYVNTDDEGPCRQFREWYIWTYKLF